MIRSRTPQEVRDAFDTQLTFLADSCIAFDSGKRKEALRMASVAYVLLHDGGKRNLSILTQMRKRAGTRFLSSVGKLNPRNQLATHDLVMIEMSPRSAIYRPTLNEFQFVHRELAFPDWWEEPIFSSGSNANLVSRKNLVFNLRNKDGGGHYDKTIDDPSYLAMAYESHWIFGGPGGEAHIMELELTSMRQVAHELLQTFKRAGLTR